jgi:membrane-associated phospholipid phosphatase
VGAGVRELILIAVLYVAYTSSRLLASNAQDPAMHRAKVLLRIERAIELDWEHAINAFFARHDLLGLLSCYWYSTAHYIVTPAVLIWLYFKGRHAYIPARRALVVATLIALALYLMLPTAPPRMMDHYVDVLAQHSDQGWWGADASAPRGMGHLTNELAAFPSLHAGWSLWCALALHRHARYKVIKVLGWAGALTTAIVVIGTANHWMLDVVVGWMVVIAGFVAVASFTPRLHLASSTETKLGTEARQLTT